MEEDAQTNRVIEGIENLVTEYGYSQSDIMDLVNDALVNSGAV